MRMMSLRLIGSPISSSSPKSSIDSAKRFNQENNPLRREVYDGQIVERVGWTDSCIGFDTDIGVLLISADAYGVHVSMNVMPNDVDSNSYSVILLDGKSRETWERGKIANSFIGSRIAEIFQSHSNAVFLYFYEKLPLRLTAKFDNVTGKVVLYWDVVEQ